MKHSTLPLRRGIAAMAAVSAVLAVAACAAAGSATGNVAAGQSAIPGCRVGAWAEQVTDAGAVAWQVSLPVDASLAYGQQLPPLAVGGLGIFSTGDTLYALRLTDGQIAWHWGLPAPESTGPGSVVTKTVNTFGGLWAWHGTVLALAEEGTAASLVSLNAVTGAVRWRIGLKAPQLWFSSDGVAVVRTGAQSRTLTAIDLETGKSLWSRSYPKSFAAVADGTTIVVQSYDSATLTGLSARTGATVWSRPGFPGNLAVLAAPGGRIVVEQVDALTLLSAGTGKTLGQLRTLEEISGLWSRGGQLVIASDAGASLSYVSDPGARLALADLATGRVRWAVAELVDQEVPVVMAPDGDLLTITTLPVAGSTGKPVPGTGSLVDSAARTGATRWAVNDDIGFLAAPQGPNVLGYIPGTPQDKGARLLVIDEATGVTVATDPIPYTATLSSASANPFTVSGGDALLEPEQASCVNGGSGGILG